MKLTQVFQSKQRTFSLEVFPAKTPEGHVKLLETLKELCKLRPDFISCTYGAGGGSRDRTFEVVQHIQTRHGVTAMAHLTCIGHTRSEIEAILKEFERRGIDNVLALRGDPPQDDPFKKPGDFPYSRDLIAFIRSKVGEAVSIGTAGFPEGHLLAPDLASDADYLRQKIAAGADFVITQLFFDNRHYFDYVKRLRALGVNVRVLPGILPVTDYAALKRFCEKCGASVPAKVHERFGPLAGDPEATMRAGTDFAIEQCRELLAGGAPGIHFYALNKVQPVGRILEAVRKT